MAVPAHQHEIILKNYELLKKDEDRYNQNSFEIRKLASTWLLATSAGISYLISQYDPTKPIGLSLNLPPILNPIFSFLILPKIGTRELIALVALLGVFGLAALAIIDLFLYGQLLKATVEESMDMETRYPATIVDVRNKVIKKFRVQQQVSRFPILRLASDLFYLVPILLLIVIMYLFWSPISIFGILCLLALVAIKLLLPIKDLTRPM